MKALRTDSFDPNPNEAERNEDVESSYPIKLRSILQANCNDCWVSNSTITDRGGNSISLEKLGVRTLDIIPRQSALNINQNHAVVKSTAILGTFKALIGFAGKVDYQRQRELYDQYIQQAVFASGYGKGSTTFGWTYGAVPGSKRMAPGVRTTYAVLAVPREALALRLSARGRAYEKDESPDDRHIITDPSLKFNMLIPTEDTQTFWVEGASYVPVRQGEWCTVILKGRNFSPQLGVLVNGMPLDRVISIATNKGKESHDHASGTETKGEYEVVNSGSLILNFTMKPGYVGTPIITLVTPEKTGDINSFELRLNHESRKRSLYEAAMTMPMFIEDFKLDRISPPFTDLFTNRQLIRLSGKGFRPNAEIFVDGVRVTWCNHLSTSAYIINRPTQDKFEVTISQPTKQSYETASLSVDPEPAQQPAIVSYSQLQRSRARVRLALTFPGQTSITASLGQFEGKIVDPLTHRAVDSCALTADADKKFRFEVEVDAEQVPSKSGRSHPVLRDMISLNLTSPGGQNKSFDILLPLTPSISKIEAASGHYASEQDVVIRGVNLQNVAKVFFGTRQAELLFQAERNAITVRVPKGAELPNGGKVRVPVRLETKVDVNGRKVSNAGDLSSLRAYYVYTGDPLTKLNGKQAEPSVNAQPTSQGSISKSQP